MRQVSYAVLAFFALGCGPDPNAHLPGDVIPASGGVQSGSGGAGTGGVGTGGTSISPTGGTGGSGGTTTPRPSGGAAGSTHSSGGASGTASSGGATGVSTGGTMAGGTGGGGGSTLNGSGGVGSGGTTSTPGSGGSTGASNGYTFPAGTEPCTPTKDISGGQSDRFGTAGAFCFRTADDFTDYGCSGVDGRSLKINGKDVTTCGGKPPAKLGSFYYFDFGPGKYDYASVNWYCSTGNCPPFRPVPSCGHYPAWQSGQTVAPCVDAPPSTAADGGAPTVEIDSGS